MSKLKSEIRDELTFDEIDGVSGGKTGDPIVTDFGGGYSLVTFEGRNTFVTCTPEQCTYHKGA